MDIAIGADVLGKDGKLGTVHRVIVDARTNTVTDLIVKHGFAWGNERVVPLGCVAGADTEGVHLDLDERGFETLNGFADDHFRAPDPSYMGPPGFNNSEFMLDEFVAQGSTGGLGTPGGVPPLGYPGGEDLAPDNMMRPVIEPGTPVLDATGEKVGEVHEYAARADDGAPDRLVLRKGLIFHDDTPVPVDWIDKLSDKGVVLKVGRRDVEALIETANQAES